MNSFSRDKWSVALSGDGLRARMIRGGMGSAGVQAGGRLLGLALSILLARMLGPDGYGVYAYCFAIMGLLMVLAEAGVPTLLMREVAAYHGRADWSLLRGVLARGFQFVGLISTLVASAGLLFLWFKGDSLRAEVVYTFLIMLLMLPLSAFCKTISHAMKGFHRVVIGQAIHALIQPMIALALIGGIFLVWPDHRAPHVAMGAQLVGTLAVLVIGGRVLRCYVPQTVISASPAYRNRHWLKSALPFILIGSAGIINNQTDTLMIGWLLGTREVGIYRVAVQGASLVAFGLMAANAVLAPQFSRLYAQGDRVRLQRLVTTSARVILVTALPFVVVFVAGGAWVLGWVFGADYVSAYLPLAILAVGQLINAAFGSVGVLLNMTGNEGVSARLLWQAAVLNIVMNALFIPPWGVAGAAGATAITLAVWNVLLYRQVHIRLGLHSVAFGVQKVYCASDFEK